MRVAVLASGSGTNLQALIDSVHQRDGIEIVAVACDNPQAQALTRAQRVGIATKVFPRNQFADRQTRDLAIADWLDQHHSELIVLAGYMALITPAFLERFPQAVINIHPSLLPAFPGLHAVEQAVAYGAKVVGVTVHFVDEGMDTGPVILQRALELTNPAADAANLLNQLRPLEHELLPRVVKLFAAGKIRLDPQNKRRVLIG